jgi:hypothetical protein
VSPVLGDLPAYTPAEVRAAMRAAFRTNVVQINCFHPKLGKSSKRLLKTAPKLS